MTGYARGHAEYFLQPIPASVPAPQSAAGLAAQPFVAITRSREARLPVGGMNSLRSCIQNPATGPEQGGNAMGAAPATENCARRARSGLNARVGSTPLK